MSSCAAPARLRAQRLTSSPLVNPKNNKLSPMISESTYKSIMKNRDVLDSAIIYERDFHYVSIRAPRRRDASARPFR